MKKHYFHLLVFCVAWLFSATSFASVPLNAFASKISLDGHFEHFVDKKSELSFSAIAQPDFIKTHFTTAQYAQLRLQHQCALVSRCFEPCT